ncbi:universal stress protein [Rhodocytophaga aerolata]|uniref:Universal stress protein n=1 Tax=Rhodocytophaga aerolata TaxID=455078 RepID=A0ABT8RE58_9BACT|nr:universal stress protein [Rhodocytophaga aerolata]MDO1450389.1 universal stress protein [Rhodocytophaga aerolata]
MKTILVPTDFSSHATNAVMYAASLAGLLNAKVILFHSYHVPVAISEYSVILMAEPAIDQNTLDELQLLEKRVKEIAGNIPVETIIREDLLLDGIRAVVKEKEVDLLVLGTLGAKGLEEVLIGSHSAYILENVDCPVLIIPACASQKKLEKIIYATDFQFNDFRYINQLIDLARPSQAQIIITHISTHKKQDEELMAWFKEIAEPNIAYPFISFKSFTGDQVLDELCHAIKFLEADMVCMATARRSFFEKILHGSLTKKMAYHCEVPLLAFHLEESKKLYPV